MKNKILLLWIVLIFCNVVAVTPANNFVQEKPIVVVIPSYNNSQWYNWNLSSVFQQEYSNYRVIYIDDCSNDNTYTLVMEKIKQLQLKQPDLANRIEVIHNTKNQGALANIYMACHAAEDHEIIVILDGDDAFAHSKVFRTINNAYQDSNVWMTYGQYKQSVNGKIGFGAEMPEAIIQKNGYRKYTWVSSHVRTYYAWLFKSIKKESLLYKGNFFPVAGDLAVMFPMLEMAGGRFEFINEILYIYNTANPLNNHKVERERQLECEKIIRQSPAYMPLLPIIYRKKK